VSQVRIERQTKYWRFDLVQRTEHILLLASFTVLSLTGLPQKWPDSSWGEFMIAGMGGIEGTRIVHHAAAAILIVLTIFHFLSVAYRIWVKRTRLTMLPTFQDVKDGFHALGYNVGVASEPPEMGRYTFGEKVEYWAVVWGTLVMIFTGLLLWNPISATMFLPGQAIPAAKAAHGGEALLAVLSIVTWHVYHVHIKYFNRSMFTGYASQHEMEEEHVLELEQIEAGTAARPVDPDGVRRRQMIFYPVAAVVGIALLWGTVYFLTSEQTAITTVPREDIPVFTPVTPTPDAP
jgi:cytochrome b subunit of formate dehydrogenase